MVDLEQVATKYKTLPNEKTAVSGASICTQQTVMRQSCMLRVNSVLELEIGSVIR